MSQAVEPFEVIVDGEEVTRLLRKIEQTRHPTTDVVPNAGDDYGLNTQWALDLRKYWLEQYSWSDAQRRINSFNHYTTTIEDVKLHFVHQESADPNAIALILIHGWPGTFHEFDQVIPKLTEGDNTSKPSFHCIVPSLPGFGFSSSAARKGWTIKDTARILHTLVTDRLGYKQYVVQAGDWGSMVARELGANPLYAQACKGIHLNFCPASLPPELSEAELTPRELRNRDKIANWRSEHIGYAVLMRTRPQTVGWMLNDNPIGLLAFVGEKFYEAASPEVQTLSSWRDHVLTTVCLYYFTNSIMTSALQYAENIANAEFPAHMLAEENRIRCPLAYTSYFYDSSPGSKRGVERTGNLVFYKERDYAGHFACLEDPDGVVEDLRNFVKEHCSLD